VAALGAAASVLVAVGLYFARSRPPEPAPGRWQAEVGSASGAVDLVRSGRRLRIAAGQELRPGDILQTGGKARAAVRLGDGTLVELNERTDLTLGGSGPTVLPHLGQGDVYVRAARQGAGHPLVFNAGRHDQAEVLGTEFELSCPEGATTLRVVDGNVRFGPTSAAVTVAAGFACQAQPGGQPGAPEPCDPGQVALWRSGRTPPAVAKVEPKLPPPPPPPPEAEPALVAKPLTVSVVENVPKAITLAADPGEASTTFTIQTGPEHGKLSGDPPQVTYAPDKDYSGPDSFTFTAGRSGGPASAAKVSITVKHVNRPPVARIAAQPAKGFAPLAVKFDASDSSDADGKITGYSWKFGDGWADQRVAADHAYANPGAYVVELTVTDDQQASDTARVTITVERDPDIIAAPTKLDGHRGGKPVAFILSWQDNSDNEEGFHVERAEVPPDFAGRVNDLKFQRLATVGPNITQAKVQLTPTPNKKSTFYFRVCAFNTKTGRVSEYAGWSVIWDPTLPDGTLNWPPPVPKDSK
jgi:PKD repeat protein